MRVTLSESTTSATSSDYSVEERFQELVSVLEEPAQWMHFFSPAAGVDVYSRPKREGVEGAGNWIKQRYVLDLSYEDSITFFRPEGSFSLDSPLGMTGIENSVVLSNDEPGDVTWVFTLKSWLICWLCLFGRQALGLGDDMDKNDEARVRSMRLVMRRDWPSVGATTLTGLHMMQPLLAPDVYASCWTILKRTSSERFTEIIEVFDVGCLPSIQPAMKLMCRVHPKNHLLPKSISHCSEKWGYMIVAMRKCCRGPPLIPTLPHSTQEESGSTRHNSFDESLLDQVKWESQPEGEVFQLCLYLRSLMKLLGLNSLKAHGCLDGRNLLWYQAAVRRQDWPQMRAAIQPVMKRHQAVYRHTRGGTAAPFIQAGVEARFAPLVDNYHNLPDAVYYGQSWEAPECHETVSNINLVQERIAALPSKNTFLHFPSPDEAKALLLSSNLSLP